MTKIEAINWYGDLQDDVRSRLQKDFDNIYDNLGSRETKFYRWLKSLNKTK